MKNIDSPLLDSNKHQPYWVAQITVAVDQSFKKCGRLNLKSCYTNGKNYLGFNFINGTFSYWYSEKCMSNGCARSVWRAYPDWIPWVIIDGRVYHRDNLAKIWVEKARCDGKGKFYYLYGSGQWYPSYSDQYRDETFNNLVNRISSGEIITLSKLFQAYNISEGNYWANLSRFTYITDGCFLHPYALVDPNTDAGLNGRRWGMASRVATILYIPQT